MVALVVAALPQLVEGTLIVTEEHLAVTLLLNRSRPEGGMAKMCGWGFLPIRNLACLARLPLYLRVGAGLAMPSQSGARAQT